MILETVFAGLLHGFAIGFALGYALEWRPAVVIPAIAIGLGAAGLAGVALASLTAGPVHIDLAYTLPLMVGSFIGSVIGITARRVQVGEVGEATA